MDALGGGRHRAALGQGKSVGARPGATAGPDAPADGPSNMERCRSSAFCKPPKHLCRCSSPLPPGRRERLRPFVPDAYRTLDTICLHCGAHTLVVDSVIHRVYVAYASLLEVSGLAALSARHWLSDCRTISGFSGSVGPGSRLVQAAGRLAARWMKLKASTCKRRSRRAAVT